VKPLTTEEIAELRKLDAGAEPPPWQSSDGDLFVSLGDEGVRDYTQSESQTHNEALACTARNALPRLLDEVECTRALLRRIEWNGAPDEVFGETCPCCCNDKQDGHEPGCELAALLGGEPTSWRSRLQAIITELDREHTPEALALANRLNDALLGGEG
jgi:hypothetical protein